MATLFLGIIIGLLLIPGVVCFLLVACDALAEFIAARRKYHKITMTMTYRLFFGGENICLRCRYANTSGKCYAAPGCYCKLLRSTL